jgi:hypothetical protein
LCAPYAIMTKAPYVTEIQGEEEGDEEHQNIPTDDEVDDDQEEEYDEEEGDEYEDDPFSQMLLSAEGESIPDVLVGIRTSLEKLTKILFKISTQLAK